MQVTKSMRYNLMVDKKFIIIQKLQIRKQEDPLPFIGH